MNKIKERLSAFLYRLLGRLQMNPQSQSSMLPIGQFRFPSPGSQPTYVAPKSPASDIFKNYYYKRDARRAYPNTWSLGPSSYQQESLALSSSSSGGSSGTSPTTASSEMGPARRKNWPPIPGSPYKYEQSEARPSAFDYYPITCVK